MSKICLLDKFAYQFDILASKKSVFIGNNLKKEYFDMSTFEMLRINSAVGSFLVMSNLW